MSAFKLKKYHREVNRNYLSSLKLITDNESDIHSSAEEPVSVEKTDNISIFQHNLDDNFHVDTTDSESSFTSSAKKQKSSHISETFQANELVRIKDSIRTWSLKNNITHSATTELLKILRSHPTLQDLPKDSRTLIKTPRYSTVSEVSPGQYIAFDWIEQLKKFQAIKNIQTINLQINVDGIPVFRSSNQQLWPVLGSVVETDFVFTIGVYYGIKKPVSVNEYLQFFVNEFLDNKTLTVHGQKIPVILKGIVCDAPARAFISGIKNHTGYYGCAKCSTKGEYRENRVVFLETHASLRTDSTFRQQTDPNHHNETTILQTLPINLVDDIPYEYMHLVCLGVTRKLLYLWTSAKKSPARLSKDQIDKINERIRQVRKFTPSEFARKPRSILELDHWKATELRQFLLYYGPIVLKGILCETKYCHFLSLTIAISILVGKETHILHNHYAEELLIYFVRGISSYYGPQYVSYNVHGLIHLAKDCLRHGSLDQFSGFKFENHLYKIKQLIRSPFNALQQVYNRVCELENNTTVYKEQKLGLSKLIDQSASEYFPEGAKNFSAYFGKDFALKISQGNNGVVLRSGEVGLVDRIVEFQNECFIVFKPFKKVQDFFTSPCKSSFISVKLVSQLSLSGEIKSITAIYKKLYIIPLKSDFVLVPLVHQE